MDGGVRSQPLEQQYNDPWKDWLKYTQNGKSAEMSELQGSSCNSRTGNEWRRFKMLHLMTIPPPMDLPSERLILSLNISPSNQHYKPSLHVHTENNADTQGDCIVGGIECVGQVPRSKMSPKSFLTDLPKERMLPPLKNKPRNGVLEPPQQHPTTQCYT